MFSPDGRRLAYVSGESGRAEVYVVSYPGPGGKWQISNDGGGEPVWARSGRELFYRNGDKMMAVDIATEPSFSAGKPKLLFEGRYNRGRWGGHPNYDVTPDGRRFLMVKGRSREQDAPNQLNVVQNWLDELKRRAAAAK
jgi:serine/threonine-protein kinase